MKQIEILEKLREVERENLIEVINRSFDYSDRTKKASVFEKLQTIEEVIEEAEKRKIEYDENKKKQQAEMQNKKELQKLQKEGAELVLKTFKEYNSKFGLTANEVITLMKNAVKETQNALIKAQIEELQKQLID